MRLDEGALSGISAPRSDLVSGATGSARAEVFVFVGGDLPENPRHDFARERFR
jgi:hypothetical protein